jgi:arylsulfatase A-like enzyme
LLVHTYDVHSPYAPPEPYRSMFLDELAEPPTPGFEPDQETLGQLRRRSWRESGRLMPARDLLYTLALYDAGIRYVDDWVGELRREMAELGLDRSAVLAIFSDHGEEFLEHGSLLHDKLYVTVARAPLVIRAPGDGSGHVVEGPVEMIDLMPTLLELARVPVPAAAQGRSLALWLDAGEPPVRPAFSESKMWKGQRAVTGPTHRVVHWMSGFRGRPPFSELYSYREDPFEQRDLSVSERSTLDDLHVDLRHWKREVQAAPPPSDEPSSIPEEVLARLRALGYG